MIKYGFTPKGLSANPVQDLKHSSNTVYKLHGILVFHIIRQIELFMLHLFILLCLMCHIATLPVFHLKVNWLYWLGVSSWSLTVSFMQFKLVRKLFAFWGLFCICVLSVCFGLVWLLCFLRLVDQWAGSSSFIS